MLNVSLFSDSLRKVFVFSSDEVRSIRYGEHYFSLMFSDDNFVSFRYEDIACISCMPMDD